MSKSYLQKLRLPKVKGCVLFSCPVILLGITTLFIVSFIWVFFGNRIHATVIAAIEKRRIEQVYTQTREASPDGVTLISEEKPQSDTFTWGLNSDPLYATAYALQTYVTVTTFSDVLADYEATFQKWGWSTVPLNEENLSLGMVFRHPSEKNLLVGLCSPVDSGQPTTPIGYVVFFDFHEVPNCDGSYLYCLSVDYCE